MERHERQILALLHCIALLPGSDGVSRALRATARRLLREVRFNL